MRVLIVSEDPAERQRATTALLLHADLDIETVEATSARAGTVIVRDQGVDVIVVDGDLQPKGGFSWLYELREEAKLVGASRPPAVVMTTRSQDDFLATWSGAEALVRKPVDPFTLADRVADLAGRDEAEPAGA